MQALQIINQKGPLPLKNQFQAPLDGPAVLIVTGTLWTTVANTLLQLNVALDGTPIATGQMWSNAASTHRAFPTLLININLTYGQHVLELSLAGQGATSDFNDFFSASILY
jgi:hypothetical protein